MTSAQIAIHAAAHYHIWGRVAALRFVQRNNCPERLYYLARMLSAAQSIERNTP